MSRRAAYPDLSTSGSLGGGAEIAASLAGRFPFFRRVPANALAALAQDVKLRRFKKGEALCRAGEATRELWALLSGRVSINRSGWNGQRVSIEIMVPGEVFGLSALVCRTYPSEIVATRDSLAAIIPKESFRRQTQRCAVLAQEVLVTLGQRLHYVETMFLLSQERVDRRLAAALLYLTHKFGGVLPINRVELAEMAGTTPETATRRLKTMETRGWIRRDATTIRVTDPAAIRAALS